MASGIGEQGIGWGTIDHHTAKLTVGLIALSLPCLTMYLAEPISLPSISQSYHVGAWPGAVFVGFLFAIAAFLLAYNGHEGEFLPSKIAALASVCVALFPCYCDGAGERCQEYIPWVHEIAAATMFGALVFFCYGFLRRALDKYKRGEAKGEKHPQALLRAGIYAACGVTIVAAMAAIVVFSVNADLRNQAPHLVFWAEASALWAFGLSWLTASRTIPGITRPDERVRPLQRDTRPPIKASSRS